MTMKETKELLVALIHLAKLLKKHLEDGIGLDDAVMLYDLVNDPVYKEALIGLGNLAEEFKKISVGDAIELFQTLLDEMK